MRIVQRYLAHFCSVPLSVGTETYISLDGNLKTSQDVEQASYLVRRQVDAYIQEGGEVVIATDDAFWVSVFLLTVWSNAAIPVFASALSARDILAVTKATVILATSELNVEEVALLKQAKPSLNIFTFTEELITSNCESLRKAKVMEVGEIFIKPHFMPKIVQMTSGSTGSPQVVARTLSGLMHEVEIVSKFFPQIVKDNKKLIMWATVPIFHAYGLLFRYLMTLFLGKTVIRKVASYEEQLTQPLPNDFTDVWLITSPAFVRRLGNKSANFNCVFLQTAGGRLDDYTARLALSYFKNPLFLEILGSTETGVMAYRMLTYENTNLWTFVEPNALKILDSNAHDPKVVKNRGIGILAIGSSYIEPHLGVDLIDEDNVTKSYFISKDLVELKGDGQHMRFIGREGRVIKVEDNRFSLDEAEELVLKTGLIEACAITEYTGKGRTSLQAALILNKDAQDRFEHLGRSKFILELRHALSKLMPALIIPRRFMFCDSLPRSATGKVKYAEVKRMFEDAFS